MERSIEDFSSELDAKIREVSRFNNSLTFTPFTSRLNDIDLEAIECDEYDITRLKLPPIIDDTLLPPIDKVSDFSEIPLESLYKFIFTGVKFNELKEFYIKVFELYAHENDENLAESPEELDKIELLRYYFIVSKVKNNNSWINFCCKNDDNDFDNSGNQFCINCNNCSRCTHLTNSRECYKCNYCKKCEKCNDCNGCKKCENCNDCNHCNNCKECTNCKECFNCVKCTRCLECRICDSCNESRKCTDSRLLSYCDSLIKCHECKDSRNSCDLRSCFNCSTCKKCEDCINCYKCKYCNVCSNCKECNKCKHCDYCKRCDNCLLCTISYWFHQEQLKNYNKKYNCIDCFYCGGCINCVNCKFCIKCNDCEKCNNCISSLKCKNCDNIFDCNNCNICDHCISCRETSYIAYSFRALRGGDSQYHDYNTLNRSAKYYHHAVKLNKSDCSYYDEKLKKCAYFYLDKDNNSHKMTSEEIDKFKEYLKEYKLN